MTGPFTNEPMTDFNDPANIAAFETALARVESQLGKTYPLVIGGRRVRKTPGTFSSTSPGRHDVVVGNFAKGTTELAERAVAAAEKAFGSWRWMPARERAAILLRAASMMRARKHELSAWMVIEVGKSWAEADGDTAEAIDFLDFYARQAVELAEDKPLTPFPGEDNKLVYIPLGVCAVIPPWNFPLAIMAGMTTAAMVAGNTVVLKPSSDAPTIAWKFFEILEEAGLPDGVVNFLPGPGSAVGNTLVEHPRTRLIAFTGSMAVGLGISERAGRTVPGQIWIKRAILEMGGKDFTIVDEDADLESAAAGVVAAAFGFQGQKCSACSRLIVHEKVHAELLERVRVGTEAIQMGDVRQHGINFGPVINKSQFEEISSYLKVGKKEGRLVTGGGRDKSTGWFIQPTIFDKIRPSQRIFKEEIFGPVLGVTTAKDTDQLFAMANDTIYGLTGAYYGLDRAKLRRAKRELHVGNLYINRKCTGALVDVHPFGGFNMSGTDSKAGGRDYLLLFTQAKSISEHVGR